MELGYFIGVMEREKIPDFSRRIVPIYLEEPSSILSGHEGIKIGISHATLALSVEEYEAGLRSIDYGHSAVSFLRELQDLADAMLEKCGGSRISRNAEQRDLPGLVRKMLLAIFSHLKTTQDEESTLKPQKQIVIRTSDDALALGDGQLPKDAVMAPAGTGNPMSIFGLAGAEVTWETFQKRNAQHKFLDSWTDAITSVVTSSLQNQLQVDNSQVIVSYDEKHAYRVILTTGTRCFNGLREFNLYFVEILRRGDFGDRDTTVLFKGLELLCRFRSLFLERNSEFSSMSCKIAGANAMLDIARGMERELNLLRRDSLELGLDKASVWAEFVDWTRLLKLAEVWHPLEARIREALTHIRRTEADTIERYREMLVKALEDLEANMRPLNAEAISEMAEKLKKIDPASLSSAAGARM
jgi:hypothetical protein